MVKKKCPKDAILTSNPIITFFKFFKIFILQTLFFSKINKIRTNQTVLRPTQGSQTQGRQT